MISTNLLGGSGVAGLEADGVNTIGLKLDLGQLVVEESSYLFASYCKLLKPMKPWSTIWIINSPIIGQSASHLKVIQGWMARRC
ncbi:MAG: hypothetical protein CM15mP49_04620 [Actinomycetota bacterium]|nr:MAG: hypothetical protein CM15mP49_04620 [Actinomycetota bacterium]